MKLWKIVLGLGVGAGVAFVASKAFAKDPGADDKPDPNAKPDPDAPADRPVRKIRHGVAYEGCEHFEIVDRDAVEAWIRDQPMLIISLAPRLSSARENPAPLAEAVLKELFPLCTWPPPDATTFGPQRKGWDAIMEEVRGSIGSGMDSSAEPGASAAGADPMVEGQHVIGALARALGGSR